VYTLQVAHAGFKTATSNNIQVDVQQSVRQDFTLAVGQASESVTVEATGTLLQAENASLGTVVHNESINQLPLNGRNYLSLVQLSSNTNTLSPASGQAGSRLGGDRASQAIAVGGQRIMFDYYTLDGVTNTDPDFNTYVGLPSLDGIAEFKVQTGVYSAEFGHEASQVNGTDGCLFGGVRSRSLAGECAQQERHQHVSRQCVRFHPQQHRGCNTLFFPLQRRSSSRISLQVERLRIRA
jgi:hypothetical protein